MNARLLSAPDHRWLYLSAPRFGRPRRTPSGQGAPSAEPGSRERGPWNGRQLNKEGFHGQTSLLVRRGSYQWWCVVRTAVRHKPSLFTISSSCQSNKANGSSNVLFHKFSLFQCSSKFSDFQSDVWALFWRLDSIFTQNLLKTQQKTP